MKQEVFDTLTELEMRDERDKLKGITENEAIQITDPDSAKYLYITALAAKAKNIVEIGTGRGYATVWLALVAEKYGGRVISCEVDEGTANEARGYLQKAGLSDYVEIVVGDARTTLRSHTDAVDLVYIDAEKLNYESYFDAVYKRMKVGSIAIADKAISDEDELEDYISYVQNHPNLDSVTVPIGNGMEVTVKVTE